MQAGVQSRGAEVVVSVDSYRHMTFNHLYMSHPPPINSRQPFSFSTPPYLHAPVHFQREDRERDGECAPETKPQRVPGPSRGCDRRHDGGCLKDQEEEQVAPEAAVGRKDGPGKVVALDQL